MHKILMIFLDGTTSFNNFNSSNTSNFNNSRIPFDISSHFRLRMRTKVVLSSFHCSCCRQITNHLGTTRFLSIIPWWVVSFPWDPKLDEADNTLLEMEVQLHATGGRLPASLTSYRTTLFHNFLRATKLVRSQNYGRTEEETNEYLPFFNFYYPVR